MIKKNIYLIIAVLLLSLTSPIYASSSQKIDNIKGLYLPISFTSERRMKQLIHYGKQAGFNAFIIHVKNPRGKIYWNSKNKTARKIGAISTYYDIKSAVKLAKKEGIYTIAKIDIFADDLLAKHHPELAVSDKDYGGPWLDKNLLRWTNPFDKRVWKYNLSLMKELVAMGFDEIQLDYVRFPSDGYTHDIYYPVKSKSKVKTISSFVQYVNKNLKPLNVNISADLFGITLWFKKDFNIGQILEYIAPYVDAVCPMIYPSHFPRGFNGWKRPNSIPTIVITESMKKADERGFTNIRPWLQAFWYKPNQVIAQIKAMEKSGYNSWSFWNASGNYSVVFKAIAKMKGITYTKPSYYPSLDELKNKPPKIIKGKFVTVNYTDYQKGYTILRIEKSKRNYKSPYRFLLKVIDTLDEAIMDKILQERGIKSPEFLTKTKKSLILTKLILKDTKMSAKKLRNKKIYLHWSKTNKFSLRANTK